MPFPAVSAAQIRDWTYSQRLSSAQQGAQGKLFWRQRLRPDATKTAGIARTGRRPRASVQPDPSQPPFSALRSLFGLETFRTRSFSAARTAAVVRPWKYLRKVRPFLFGQATTAPDAAALPKREPDPPLATRSACGRRRVWTASGPLVCADHCNAAMPRTQPVLAKSSATR